MSLKVWLPLDGDLRNLGVSNVEVTNNGASINNSGKIGSCYHFGSSSPSFMTLPKEIMTSFTTECSVAFWLKIKTWNVSYATYFQAGLGSTPWTHYIFGFLRNSTKSTACFTISNGSSASNANYLTSTLELNKWYHVALTYKTGKCIIYLDGKLDHEYSTSIIPAFSSIKHITLGACNDGSNYQTDCDMNDVRIYDHCLSAAEVHEIAQGLVLHYKLDGNGFGNRNYLKTIISSGLQTRDCNYNYDINTGTYTLTVTRNVGNFQQIWNTNLVTNVSEILGKQMIISCEDFYTTDPNSDIRIYLYYTPTSIPSTRVYKGQNTVTIPSNATQIGLIIRCDQKCNAPVGTVATFKGIKLELGDKTTKWFPAEEDLGIDTIIITDSSGYGHNGEITGTLTTSSDTAKYTTSTVFNGSSYITIPKIFENNVLLSEFTWAGWVKRTYTDTNEHTVYNGITHIRFRSYNNNNFWPFITWYHSTGNNSPINTWTTGPSLPENTWAHIAFTFKNGVLKYYYNGMYSGISNRSSTGQYIKTNYGTTIGYYGTGTPNYWIGNLSDVRVYTTQLLDTDIKLLYKMGMRVDNLGGIHTFEYIEDEEEEKNTLQGLLKTNEIEEYNGIAKIKKNKGWLSPNFIEM